MLALTIVHGVAIFDVRASSRRTQPASTGMLCAADNESPSTSTLRGASAAEAMGHHANSNRSRQRRMSDSSRVLLEVADVSKSVFGPEGRLDILSGVNLSGAAGGRFAIVGGSGSGKTTPLRL